MTPLAALRAVYGDRVAHERGCAVTGDDTSGIDAAVTAATDAAVAIVFVGGESGLQPHSTVGEARDATSLALTGVQHQLVDAVIATGTPTVVVLVSGRVHSVAGDRDERGRAGAGVARRARRAATGSSTSSPARRPVGEAAGLDASHRRPGPGVRLDTERVVVGACSTATTPTPRSSPLFPFGHGLSYATFERSSLTIDSAGTTAEPVAVSIDTENTSDRAGVDVVQLTVRDDVASVARHQFFLCGFARVPLEPGERRTVRFTVHPSRLAFYDPHMRFVVEPGTFTFRVDERGDDGDARR